MNAATDTLCSTLTSCLDDICPLSSRPARTAPSNPWLSDVLRGYQTRLRAADKKLCKLNDPLDLRRYQLLLFKLINYYYYYYYYYLSLLKSTRPNRHISIKINSAPNMRNLFRTFNSLLCPPSPPPTTSITADDFATFSQTKLEQSIVSFHLHTHRTSNQPHPLLKFPSSPSVPSRRRKYLNFSSSAILQLILQSLPHSYQHSHFINTSLLPVIFPTAFKQARVTPLLKKPTLNTSLLENYRPVSLLPFIAKTLKRVVFNQVSLFLSQNNKLDAKQSGFRSGHSTETALLSVTEALRIAKVISKSSVLILLDLSAAFDTVIRGSFRSSCPPSHHWTSLGLIFAGLDPISLVCLSRWLGEGRYPKHINCSLGFPRDRFLDHFSSPHTLHHWLPSYRHMASPTIATLMTHSSISHFDQMIQR